jgi:hypothetical protein
MSYSYRFALLRLLFWGNLVRWADSQDAACTLCFGGQEPTNLANGTLATGITCEFSNSIIGSTPSDSPDCIKLQMEAYQGCGCPAYDQEAFCPMCSDASFFIPTPLAVIPTIDMTCGRALFVMKESGLCDATRRAAFICGCSGAVAPECFYCSDGVKPTMPTRILPPHYNVTCGDLNAISQLYTDAECPSLTADMHINMDKYCGCNNNGSPSTDNATETFSCSLCGETPMALPNATYTFAAGEMTCADLSNLAEAIDDTAFCTNFKDDYFDYCCLGITGKPSMAPDAADADAPTPATPVEEKPVAQAPTTSSSSTASRAKVSLYLLLGTLLCWSSCALIYS